MPRLPERPRNPQFRRRLRVRPCHPLLVPISCTRWRSISSAAAARQPPGGFTEFLAQYPQHERAGDAQYFIAETLERDQKAIDAEAAYLSVYTRFPQSEKAPTAMFKRAALLRTQNKPDRAREVLDLLVKTYPRSDEADLARERLRAGPP